MKKSKTFFLIFLLGSCIVCTLPVMAQSKIGYINSQKILATYPAAVDAQKKLEAESNKWGQELQKMEADFQSKKEELEQQSLLLSEEKKRERALALENLATEAQKFQNDKWGEQGEFFRRREELLKPVIDQINEVINQIGDEENYDFIFDSLEGNLLFAKDKYDLTDQVLEELEKKTPSDNASQ